MLGFLFGPPSRQKFTKISIAAARKAGVAGEFTVNEPDFSLKHGTAVIYLGNLYDEYCSASTAHKKVLLHNYLSLLGSGDDTITREQAFEQCVAAVREHALFSFMGLRTEATNPDSNKVAYRPLSDWFVRSLVIDSPGHMRMVLEEDLKDWGTTFDELFEVGLERLKDCTTPSFAAVDGYFIGTWNDDYDSSRILLPELFDALPIKGTPVFCIPRRLTLLVADSTNVAAVMAMLSKAEEIIQNEPRPQNPSLLTYRDGEVVDFRVPPTSALYASVQRASRLAEMICYEEQKAILEELHEKTGKDIYVGKLTLIEHADHGLVSYSVWSNSIPTLLPKTDLIMLLDPERPEDEQMRGAVRWEDVVAVAGDLMLDTEMFPPRFYVSKFPTEAQLAAMPKVEM